jgi:hypothetical protein
MEYSNLNNLSNSIGNDVTTLSAATAALGGALLGFGYQLYNLSEEDFEKWMEKLRRDTIGFATVSLAIHIFSSRKFRYTAVKIIEARNSAIAILSGSVISLGCSFIFHTQESMRKSLIKSFGGGIFSFGVYIWAPVFLRALWDDPKNEMPLTLQGASYSALSGLVLVSTANYLMVEEREISDESKLKQSIGGGILGAGIYLWAPPIIRGFFSLIF